MRCGGLPLQQCCAYVKQALKGVAVAFENKGTTHGKRFFTQSSFIPDFDARGQVQGFYAMTFDVTAGKEAVLRRLDSERRLRGLADNILALLTELDRKRSIKHVLT